MQSNSHVGGCERQKGCKNKQNLEDVPAGWSGNSREWRQSQQLLGRGMKPSEVWMIPGEQLLGTSCLTDVWTRGTDQDLIPHGTLLSCPAKWDRHSWLSTVRSSSGSAAGANSQLFQGQEHRGSTPETALTSLGKTTQAPQHTYRGKKNKIVACF